MERKTYREKLLDPRWQRKRLEILQRDEFQCRSCMDTETTLHVHHRYYRRGVDPWNYPDSALVTLCISCHETAGMASQALAESSGILSLADVEAVWGYADALSIVGGCAEGRTFRCTYGWSVGFADGIQHLTMWPLSAEDVCDVMGDGEWSSESLSDVFYTWGEEKRTASG